MQPPQYERDYQSIWRALDVGLHVSTKAPTWRNAFEARAVLSLLVYRPGETAGQIRAPMLVCVADFDTAGSVKLVRTPGLRRRSDGARVLALRRYTGVAQLEFG